MCLRARIRGCSIDLRLLVRKECVYGGRRVDHSTNGRHQETRAVLCDLRPSEILKAELELKSGQVVSGVLYPECHMLESSNSNRNFTQVKVKWLV